MPAEVSGCPANLAVRSSPPQAGHIPQGHTGAGSRYSASLHCCTNHLNESPKVGCTFLSSRHQKLGLLPSKELGSFPEQLWCQWETGTFRGFIWTWLSFTDYRDACIKPTDKMPDCWMAKVGWGGSDHDLAELCLLISGNEILNIISSWICLDYSI